MKCKKCEYWMNKQAELSYGEFDGICICPKLKFTTTNSEDAKVLDRKNLSQAWNNVQRFESVSVEVPVGEVSDSRYCFVTAEDFGCIHFVKR